jgi:photosystem II stability/assembly factor-like uncharacterized protein
MRRRGLFSPGRGICSALAAVALVALAAGTALAAPAATPRFTAEQAKCIRFELGAKRASALAQGAKPTAKEQAKLARCGVRPAGSGGAPGQGSGGGSGSGGSSSAPSGAALVAAGAHGVVRVRTTSGGAAQPMDCTRSDGNQGFRTQETFTVDPRDPKRLYVAVEFDGVFVSRDRGATWTRSSKGLIGYPRADAPTRPCLTEMASLLVDPRTPGRLLLTKTGEPGTIGDVFSENNGVYESRDGGASWRQILTQPGIAVYVKSGIAVARTGPAVIYAGTTSLPRRLDGTNAVHVKRGLVLVTRDGGRTWAELPTGVTPSTAVLGVFTAADDPRLLLVSTLRRDTPAGGGQPSFSAGLGLIRSTDGGTTWKRVDSLPDGSALATLSAGGPRLQRVAAATHDGQVLWSADGGTTFEKAQIGGTPFVVRLEPGDPAGLRGLAADFGGGIHVTADGGATWTQAAGSIPRSGGLGPRVTWFEWGSDGAWYAAGHYAGSAGGQPKQEAFAFRSDDRGVTWTRILSPAVLPR